ncbi:hypothetical protein ACLOJK_006132 [Asimina triloba]
MELQSVMVREIMMGIYDLYVVGMSRARQVARAHGMGQRYASGDDSATAVRRRCSWPEGGGAILSDVDPCATIFLLDRRFPWLRQPLQKVTGTWIVFVSSFC